MKTLISVMVVVVGMFVAFGAQAGEELQTLQAYYEKAIEQEIAACLKKSELRDSRSVNLRLKGHREASKALFLQTHREGLVDSMLAMQLKPVDYKVQRFLNERFCGTCYAQWAMRGTP